MVELVKGYPRSPAYFRKMRESVEIQRSKEKSIHAEATRITSSEMANAGLNKPPVDLEKFARHLGVRDIRYAPLAMRGRLVLDSNRIVVEINEDLDNSSRIHTLAHELAHLVLEKNRIVQSTMSGSNVERSHGHKLIEKLCDVCGDEILLPRDWLGNLVSDNRAPLSSVLAIAESTGLSVSFVVKRIIDLGFRPWRALWCIRREGKIQVVKAEPYWPDSFLAWVDIDNSAHSPVSRCWSTESVVEGRQLITIEGEPQSSYCECVKLDDALALCVVYLREGKRAELPGNR